MINDYKKMENACLKEKACNKEVNTNLFGKQGGYSSGRSQNIKINYMFLFFIKV